ncbi:hypothetical protein AC1031_020245 [Aphanomyces cochlioides]|nr:hypothetical protein AC1031_020245 [Aphanomyces cochlioides]
MDPPAKKRKTQVRFDAETDLDLVKEVLAQNLTTKDLVRNEPYGIQLRRERCTLLSDAYAQKQKEMHKASGVEDRRLTLEERRLEIEERKAAHEAERFALEKQERLALINLLSNSHRKMDHDFKNVD